MLVTVSHAVVYTQSLFKVVSYMTRPATGLTIAFFCAVVIIGNKTPCVVDSILIIADETLVCVPTNKFPFLFV
jgi:hypothetical protein